MNDEIKRISESILSHLEEEREEKVLQYSLAKAELSYENEKEVYWMIRKIEADPIYGVTIKGDKVLKEAGSRIHLPEKEGEIYIARDSKFGGLLISRSIGKITYEEPSGNKVILNVFNTSLFDPNTTEEIDVKNVSIRTLEATFNFPSLKEEIEKLL